ncbi:hypothetical protein NCCP2716_18710 [Sporosarcina sp. NCCP-2716]|uniref:hypothetical protein n=1 Tax=Sporosarcina sp. NCCP-2716 TaxID=2943679 RepID=UPI002041B629|nr:hypothetical protein [Sporosarcina sp. NCCP-2716]GKV69373.1 hypothetical protein NCCP2716_18710 [Sporosarcina sp. NCCP-2716]
MPALQKEEIANLEKMIYLPMLLTVLERDRLTIEQGNFKLKKPYLAIVEGAAQKVHRDLGNTAAYLKMHRMSVVRGKMDDIFTEYTFLHDSTEDRRRYLNVRLRNRTEELLTRYLRQPDI